MKKLFLLSLLIPFSLPLFADNNTCSWVGSDDACREKAVGTLCAVDGMAGVCAINYWDRCSCVRTHNPRIAETTPEVQKTCGWVGSHSACRDKPIGTICANEGAAGMCAVRMWDHCDCVKPLPQKARKKGNIRIIIEGE